MIIKDVSEIISGHIFRGGITTSTNSDVRIIKLKDMNYFGHIDYTKLEMVEDDGFKEFVFLKRDDILIKAKTNRISTGVVYPHSNKLVPTNHFFILRITQDNILPEYLSWYLKQRRAMTYFAKRAAGTAVPMINKRIIEELDIIVPDIKTQQNIIKSYHLQIREYELRTLLRDKRFALINQILLNSIERVEESI